MHILVAVDGSEASAKAFERACALATPRSKLTLLAVTEGAVASADMDLAAGCAEADYFVIPDSARAEDRKRTEKLLASLAHKCSERNITVNSLTCEGDPRAIICDSAEHLHVDLVVVGRRGMGQAARLVVGSVSEYVTRHAPCSVLTVKH
eukprot:TRINITY_DN362_c0_g1_i1.p1 TRINITY_DN362_c0_g1~~TRINITY_DN362_c0_g1_i1.p1  ORF type:complete len:158 (-),score=40.26 TRINITY_DN362_c0_g1_i1:390-839(-)